MCSEALPAPFHQGHSTSNAEIGNLEPSLLCLYYFRPEVDEKSKFKHRKTQASLNSYQWSPLLQNKAGLENEQIVVSACCTPRHCGVFLPTPFWYPAGYSLKLQLLVSGERCGSRYIKKIGTMNKIKDSI